MITQKILTHILAPFQSRDVAVAASSSVNLSLSFLLMFFDLYAVPEDLSFQKKH